MKVLSTLIFILIASTCFAQPVDTSKVVVINCWGNGRMQKKDTAKTADWFYARCGTSILNNNSPLIVVDGIPYDTSIIKSIDPNDIESIDILKNIEGAIISCRSWQRVIVITTKKSNERKLIIKDFIDAKVIAGATVSFVAVDRKDSVLLVANDSGTVITKKLRRSVDYTFTITAIGYQKIESIFRNSYGYKKQEVFLCRDIKTCDPVILSQTICNRMIRCGMYSVCRRIKTRTEKVEEDKPIIFKVYPIPAQRGATLTLQFNNDENVRSIRIISLEGRNMQQQSINLNQEKGVFKLSTDIRWAAGIYFIQLLYENGQVAASEKIILQ